MILLKLELGELYGMNSIVDLMWAINNMRRFGMTDREIQEVLDRSKVIKKDIQELLDRHGENEG